MKILIFNWRDIRHPQAGGAETVTFEHAKAWVKSGNKVTWFSSAFEGGRKDEVIDGIRIVRQGKELSTVYFKAFFWYLKYAKGQIDLVIDQFHGIPFFTPLYVKEKKLAFIHETAHEVWFLNHLLAPLNFLIGFIGYFIEPWIFRLFYRQTPFLTVSDSTRNQLINWDIPQKNITVIHNGVNLSFSRLRIKKEQCLTIVFLGVLDKDKGIEDAIKAFNTINQKSKNCQFWIVGKGRHSYVKKLKTLVKKFNLVEKVRFFGFVSEDKKFELLARSHLLINPSVREGWGLVVIEANAMKTPAVVYDVPGLCDSTKDGATGLICAENTPEDLAGNVTKLLKDKKLYEKLQDNALIWSKKFTWRKATRESLELIEKIVK